MKSPGVLDLNGLRKTQAYPKGLSRIFKSCWNQKSCTIRHREYGVLGQEDGTLGAVFIWEEMGR